MAGYIGTKASVVSSGAERKKVFDITTTTTSLTGCSYTPNQVHVFHNGVRLVDGTDYTATDGSTVTLTTAAQNGDEVVVISYATFQTSDTVSASAGGTFAGAVAVNGNLTVDTNTLFVNAVNNRVGVGTTTPDSSLHVEDDGAFPITLTRNGGTNSNASIRWKQATTSWYAGVNADNSFAFKYDNPDLTTGNALAITSTGSVGIGTTAPTSQLTVTRNQGADTAIEVSNLGTAGLTTTASFIVSETAGVPNGWFRRYRDGTARTDVGFSTNLTFSGAIGTTPVERARIDASGNLLVGTTSGSDKVTVNGTVNATAFVGDGSALTGIIPTTAGAVGTYANVVHYGGELSFGATIAGSSVHPVSISKSANQTTSIGSTVAFGSLEGALSGTWRVMASGRYSGTRSYSFLALRIS